MGPEDVASASSSSGSTLFNSREFLNSLAEGVMLISNAGQIVDCNETALALIDGRRWNS
jgi:sensor histidine kinase regulating citrate/malate metabolism